MRNRTMAYFLGRLYAENQRLRMEKMAMHLALEKAVADYGQPGGPWNVPSEPGTWLHMAKQALGVE